jgi:hypothetical protein
VSWRRSSRCSARPGTRPMPRTWRTYDSISDTLSRSIWIAGAGAVAPPAAPGSDAADCRRRGAAAARAAGEPELGRRAHRRVPTSPNDVPVPGATAPPLIGGPRVQCSKIVRGSPDRRMIETSVPTLISA